MEVAVGIGRGSEEKIRKLISKNPIDLFRHGAVAGAQAGLYMRYADSEFGTNERGGQGGIYIAVDKNPVRLALLQHWFQASHDLGGLAGVTSGADLQIDVALGHFQLGKKYFGHRCVVMLAGVDETLVHAGLCRERSKERRRLHEVWARAHHVKNVHSWLSAPELRGFGRGTI